MINIEDFLKLDIRIGTIEEASKVENADKLVKLIIEFGEEKRQIMSAIAEFFPDPSVLVGKQIPVLINLEPRKFRGYESQGMIVAGDVDGRPVLLNPAEKVPNGSKIK